MANRLAHATSPYLLQHAENPVDWWEWGPEAFAEAKRRDAPILLSVGYAACHWCHVMAHESFEDDAVAAVVNASVIPVKVDREERPDIDAVYMAATQALTGHGGWPMTCLLDHDRRPFFAGTYFPKDHFTQLLLGVHDAWTTRRDEVLASSAHITAALERMVTSQPGAAEPIGAASLDAAVERLAQTFDPVDAGFGRAPKFPPSMVLAFLLRAHARTGDPRALSMVEHTCDRMARGGLCDQLAGGFARYSVDASWVVPHFEKMLYDNGLLLGVYADLAARGSGLAGRVAHETADFLLRDLRTPEGVFASALDADTAGVEGLTYAWTPQQLVEVLGPEDAARAATLLDVTPAGTFEHGMSTLQLRVDPADSAWWAHTRLQLLGARSARPQPARDDKAVTAWNGLAIAGLARAGAVLERTDLIDAAALCAEVIWATHRVGSRLRRASRDGVVGAALAVASDYGNLAYGLLVLHQHTSDPVWLERACALLDEALGLFGDDSPGEGFFDTGSDAERLITRPRDLGDNAEPGGNSALAHALLTASALIGSSTYRQAADAAVAAAAPIAQRDPRFAGWALACAEAALAGPLQVALALPGPDRVDADDAVAGAMWRQVVLSPSPGIVAIRGQPDATGVPLLAGRPTRGGQPTAYVCRGFVCDLPVTTQSGLGERLR